MFNRMVEVEDLRRTGEMNVDKILQTRAAVGQGDPLLGVVHPHLPGLTTHLRTQLLQIIKPREATNPIARLGKGLLVALTRLRKPTHRAASPQRGPVMLDP
jgi:hypothetical protein